jgi:hypothetical protein
MTEGPVTPPDVPTAARDGSTNGSGEMPPREGDPIGAEPIEEEDGQYAFEIEEQGKRVTLGSLIKRGTPVKYEFKLGAKAIKGSGGMGLISFDDPEMTLVVPVRAGAVTVEPTYDGDGGIKHVTVRAAVKPLTCYDARSEAALIALRGEQ